MALTEHDLPPVSRVLTELQIPHRIYRHLGPVHSLEQAAQERGQTPDQVVRSILFRITKVEYVMALMAGPGQIDWKALRRHLGQSRLTMASREEVLAVTGYEIGAVSPFGLPTPIPVLVDLSVTAQEEISIGSGQRSVTVILKSSDLMRTLHEATIGAFGVKE